MMPPRSTSEPIMKPGTSARYTSGTEKASQSQMKRDALSAESLNSTPPLTAELLATMPTVSPFIRANPTTSSAANNGLTSKKLSSSTSPSMKSWMSNGWLSRSGTEAPVSGSAGSSGWYVGSGERQLPGRYEK